MDGHTINAATIVEILRREVLAMVAAGERERALRPPDPTGLQAADAARHHQAIANSYQRSLVTNSCKNDEAVILELCRKYGVELTSGTQIAAEAARLHARALLQFHLIASDQELGKFVQDRELFLAPANGVVSDASVVPAAEAGSPELSRIDSIFSVYVKEKLLAEWTEKTRIQSEQTLRVFKELVGVEDIGAVTRRTAAEFKQKLMRLPAKYGQCSAYAGKPANEVLELSSGSAEPRLSAKTVNRHIDALGTFWKWAKVHGHVTGENPFQGLLIAKSKRPRLAHEDREMFDGDDLRRIFTSPLYAGCRSGQRRLAPGNLIIRDGRFWVPLIAAFSGARLEEICQLHAADIREFDGVWSIVIEPGVGKRLKNANSQRAIPIHPVLLSAGLVDHAKSAGQAGHTNLFPELPRGGPDNTYGFRFTKWFTTFRRAVGIEEGKSFHSFRHSFDTYLQRAGADERHVGALLGHRSTTETSGRYFKGFPARQLFDAISMLDYCVPLCLEQRKAA